MFKRSMPLPTFTLLVAIGIPIMAEDDGTNGQSGAERSIAIHLQGQAQGGTLSICSLLHQPKPLAVQTTAGETAAQVVAKLAAVPDSPIFSSRSAQGEVLKGTGRGFSLYCVSTDPGLPTPACVKNFRAEVNRDAKVVSLTWENPDPAPSAVVIYRDVRPVGAAEGGVTSIQDTQQDAWTQTQQQNITYRAVAEYEKVLNGESCSSFSNVVSIEVENPWYDPNDLPPSPNVPPILPNAKVNAAYAYEMKDYRLNPNVLTWTLATGNLPPGLMLSERGVLSGVATQAGKFRFEVKVTGRLDPPYTFPCVLTVDAP